MKNRQAPKTGFTLIELLVVISIIALLLSIMMPGLNKARSVAQRVICVSNNRQWAIGTANYAADWNDLFPRVTCSIDQVRNSSFFRNVTSYASSPNRGDNIDYDLVSIFIQPYVGEPQFMECPSRRDPLYDRTTWSQVWEDAHAGKHNYYIGGDYAYYAGNEYRRDRLAAHIRLDRDVRETNLLPLRISQARSGMAVVGDVVVHGRLTGDWSYSHPWNRYQIGKEPVGMAAGFVDGSARWVTFEEMSILFEYMQNRSLYYWPTP